MSRLCLTIAAWACAVCLICGPLAVPAAAATPSGTPIVTTNGAGSVTPTAALVSGTVDLNGASLTPGTGKNCYFQYGTSSTSETTQVACSPTPSSSGVTTVTAELTGLTGASTYHYNLEVVTGGALIIGTTTTAGNDQSFTTPDVAVRPMASSAPATRITGTAATLNGSANAENWSVSACDIVLTPAGGAPRNIACPNAPTGSSAQSISVPANGLAEGTDYSYVVSLTYTTSSGAATVKSGPTSFTTPSAVVSPPTNLTATSATLKASVDPAGQTVTDCEFYYGTSGPTLKTIPCTLPADQISGTAPIAVNANVTGLSAKTTYLETVVLTTAGGYTAAPGASFLTPAVPPPPSAVTQPAAGVSATTATLHATVNPQGLGVQACEFEYGVDPFASATSTSGDVALTEPCQTPPGTPTAADGGQPVSATLTGLAPGRRYYDRVLLLTSGGYVIANTQSFRTAAILARPGVRLLRVSARGGRLQVRFLHTGPAPTRGYQCALTLIRHGDVAAPAYRACSSPASYTHLRHGGYVFSVRAVDANGPGPVTRTRLRV